MNCLIQRYKCKSCDYKYTVELKSTAKSKSITKQALQLYLEELGFHSIGKILNVSDVSILKWKQSFGGEISALRNEDKVVEVVELDKIHSFIGSKKTVAEYGLLLIDVRKDFSTYLDIT